MIFGIACWITVLTLMAYAITRIVMGSKANDIFAAIGNGTFVALKYTARFLLHLFGNLFKQLGEALTALANGWKT